MTRADFSLWDDGTWFYAGWQTLSVPSADLGPGSTFRTARFGSIEAREQFIIAEQLRHQNQLLQSRIDVEKEYRPLLEKLMRCCLIDEGVIPLPLFNGDEDEEEFAARLNEYQLTIHQYEWLRAIKEDVIAQWRKERNA